MSHPWLSYLPSCTFTSFSSINDPHTQQVHHAHLQALLVDKQRHEESLWREDLQSGGNPRKTFSTGCEPKELATVSKISPKRDPFNYMMYKKGLDKKITELRSPKKWRNLEKLERLVFRILEISETSYFQSQMHFDDSVESTADSDLEDGVTKDVDFTTVCPESFGETRCNGHSGKRVKCTTYPSRTKGKFDVSSIWRVRKLWGLIWTGKLDQVLRVQKS